MRNNDHLDRLLDEAKATPLPQPPTGLVERVLSDAAIYAPSPPLQSPRKRPGFFARLLSPVGGKGGAFALAACAAFGIFAGAGYADILFEIPALEGLLAFIGDNPDSTSPFETLSQLMAES